MTPTRNEYDFRDLRGLIVKHGFTMSSFAERLNMTPANLSKKLNNKSYFDTEQISNIAAILNVEDARDIGKLFFTLKNSKN